MTCTVLANDYDNPVEVVASLGAFIATAYSDVPWNGPMGTTCIAVLLCCGLYLAVRRTIIWQIPVATLGLVALSGWLFPRVNASHTISILMELTSGVLIFAVIFVAAMDNGEA